MHIVRDILFFLLANALGFMAAPIVYNSAILTGFLSANIIEANAAGFQARFFSATMLTWMFCALVSLGFFLIKGKLRIAFLLCPAVLPLLYGFSVLNGLS